MHSVPLNVKYLKAAAVISPSADVRYYLNGVLVDVRARETRIVSTDGHRLVIFRTELAKDVADQAPAEIIVPLDTVKALKAMKNVPDCLLHYPDDTAAEGAAGECRFDCLKDGGAAIFRAIQGKYPDYMRVIPSTEPSGELGHFNLSYVGDFHKVCGVAFDTAIGPQIWHNGPNSTAVVLQTSHPEFLGVLQPLRADGFNAPDWHPMPKAEAVAKDAKLAVADTKAGKRANLKAVA